MWRYRTMYMDWEEHRKTMKLIHAFRDLKYNQTAVSVEIESFNDIIKGRKNGMYQPKKMLASRIN